MTDVFDYWRKAMAGETPPIHEGDPQVGYYRKRNKPYQGKPMADEPVSIRYHGDDLIAVQGTATRNREVDPAAIWTWVADKPVSYEDYLAAFEESAWERALEGIAPARGVGDNNPPCDPFEAFRDELGTVLGTAEQAMSEDIVTKEDADRLANIKDRLLQLGKDGEQQRKAEKKPHDEAAKAIQNKWAPLLKSADDAKRKLLARLDTWLRDEEQRQARATFEAAKAAEAAGEELPIQNVTPIQVGGNVSGRKTSSRSRKIAEIIDPAAFATFLLSGRTPNPDLMATLQKCANKIAVSGAQAPGITIDSKRTAA